MLAISNICEMVLPLIRSMVLARLLSSKDFGLAISITVVVSTIELISDLGFAQMALRAGSSKTIGTLHALAIIRGAALALVIAIGGPFFAKIFDTSGTDWVYALVGLTCFIRSLQHLEPKIRMRDYNYIPEAILVIGAQASWTVVSIVAALILHDFRAMAIGLIAYAVGAAVISHLCSESRYTLGWDKEMVSESFRYGRPLTLNGIALAVTGLGDRFLTGSRIGLEQLAQYTAMATAAFTPRSVIVRFVISLFVPHFVNATSDLEKQRFADIWIILMTGLGSLFGFCYIAFGQVVVAAAFGKHYMVDQNSINLVSILTCIRYMASIPVAPSMANGRTSFVLLNTTLAASGLILAAILLCFSLDLHIMLIAMIFGEGFALLFVLSRLGRTTPLSASTMWISVLLPLAALVIVAWLVAVWPEPSLLMRWFICSLGISVESTCVYMLLRRAGWQVSSVWRIVFPRHRQTIDVPAS